MMPFAWDKMGVGLIGLNEKDINKNDSTMIMILVECERGM